MDRPKTRNRTLIGLFFISAASLGLEVLVTRIYSYLFVQSYVYIIISCSMAGIGFGAVAMHFIKDSYRPILLRAIIFIPTLMLVVLFVLNSSRAMLVPSLIITFLIFSSVGIMQVQIFQKSDIGSSTLYATDLLGASVGVVSSFFAMNMLDVINTAYLAILVMSAGYIIINMASRTKTSNKYFGSALAVITTVLVVSGLTGLGRNMHPNQMWQKEMTVMLDEEEMSPRITQTEWTSFGRVDLVETDNPLFKTLFIDGGAGTKMIEMRGGQVRPALAESLLFNYMGGVPLLIVDEKDRDRAAVIGSGGGIDVVTLLLADYKYIDAVEINPDFIRLVREQSDYNGGIYIDNPRVAVYNDEGRAFLRDRDRDYNLILMGLPIIKSSRNFTNHSLTENYLFTQDAFAEYLEALEPGGFLVVISHYPNELKRLFSNAVKSISEKFGISESMATQHIATIGDDRNPTLILKSGIFSPSEVEGLKVILNNLPVSGSVNFVPLSGDSTGNIQFDKGMVALSRGQINLAQFIDAHNEDISWVTDDSPFFYQMTKRLPSELRTVLLIASLLTAGAILGFALRQRKQDQKIPAWNSMMMFLSFGCIGIGFMMVEIKLIQMFTIFWHHQTKALSVVLASILAAAGTGSLVSSRIKNNRAFILVMGVLVVIQVMYALFADEILAGASLLPAFWKIPVTFGLVAPLFIIMGIPFPYLLKQGRTIAGTTNLYPWFMGFNSFLTLAGGVLSLTIAMTGGYKYLFIAGIISYVVMMMLQVFIKREQTDSVRL